MQEQTDLPGSPVSSSSRQLFTGPRVHERAADSHRFVVQALRYLAGQGLHQYVTVGAGEPAHRALQEAVRAVDPWAPMAAVDVGAGRFAVRRGQGQPRPGNRSFLQSGSVDRRRSADRRRSGICPPSLLWSAAASAGLDRSRPVVLLLVGVLHHLVDEREARDSVSQLAQSLPSGSYVVSTHVSSDHSSSGLRSAVRAYARAGLPLRPRSRDEFAELLSGLELLPPGVVLLPAWRRDSAGRIAAAPEPVACWGATGRVS